MPHKNKAPINIFNLEQVGINKNNFINKIQKFYHLYEPDLYLVRQEKIKALAKKSLISFEKDSVLLTNYYSNIISEHEFKEKLNFNASCFFDTLSNINSYRKRLISTFIFNKDSGIKRIKSGSFNQAGAGTKNNTFDFRIIPRLFKEAPEEMESDDLFKLIFFIADRVFQYEKISQFKVITHYTLIDCFTDDGMETSNSPEGIHQDGVDYIVSALVLERVNISGGDSKIYIGDKNNHILTTQLQSGQGIFQPDKGTDLWHEVTPVKLIDPKKRGYRSTLGFDIDLRYSTTNKF
ncbi:2OG-Fe dioxygenase family protein [Xenorhabdus sp. Flor]|uniref:2OG-Fe dioxygenase family protein n=1 Tax=Xenorhabdus cabanillasii TaxID=351673 RepID=UPI001987E43D|nr:2OG-Fe dioxygenase family protein [Xenorhabdus sp. Flor]MBD2816217.1 2OG-Fe dioxygenase family protein [Xenorhabdus sp. Flor]